MPPPHVAAGRCHRPCAAGPQQVSGDCGPPSTVEARAGLDFEALKRLAQTRDFKPLELPGGSLSAAYDVDAKVITSQNIAGRIDGSQKPGETVIYSAHWDQLGVGKPDASGDRIYNGEVDNATGTVALIELGRAFARAPRPERSLVFLAVTAEEKGLPRSEYYSANQLYPLGKTVVLNMGQCGPLAELGRGFGIPRRP